MTKGKHIWLDVGYEIVLSYKAANVYLQCVNKATGL